MRNRTGIAVGLALALSLAAVLVQAAGAEVRRHSGLDSEDLQDNTFNVSGEFTGILGGDITLNGNHYFLSDNVQVYEIGRGLIPAGTSIDSRFIFMAGNRSVGSETISFVIVRPAVAPSPDQDDPGSHISIHTTPPELE